MKSQNKRHASLPRISPRGRVRAPAIPRSPRTKSLLSAAMGPELPSLFFSSPSTRNPLRHPLLVPESRERERFVLATKSRRLRVGCWREVYVMLHNDVVIVDDCSIGVSRGCGAILTVCILDETTVGMRSGRSARSIICIVNRVLGSLLPSPVPNGQDTVR